MNSQVSMWLHQFIFHGQVTLLKCQQTKIVHGLMPRRWNKVYVREQLFKVIAHSVQNTV